MSTFALRSRPGNIGRLALIATALCLLLAGCGEGSKSDEGTGSQPYSGTTLKVIAEAALNTQVMTKLVPAFEQQTGIDVVIEQAPYDALVQKATLDFGSHKGNYDVISIPYEYLGAFAEKRYIVPDILKKGGAVSGYSSADIIPALWDVSSNWKGQVYGAPSNSGVMMMFYRKDLFEHPAEREAFSKRYGHSLEPARTWGEYQEIAEFFTRRKGQMLAGQKLTRDFYGLTLTAKRHVATVLEYFNYAWTSGGGFFSEEGVPMINSRGNVQGLAYEVGLTPYAPPSYTTTTWDEMTTAFQQGTVAQAIAWGDTAGGLEDPKASRVAGKMGYASIPVAASGDKPVAHLGSWTYTVNADSRHQDAAALFIKWALSRDVQTKLAQAGGLPALTSVFKDPALAKKLPYWGQEFISLSQARARPRIPEWGAMADVLQQELSKALDRSTPPQTALDGAQERIMKLLEDSLPITDQ